MVFLGLGKSWLVSFFEMIIVFLFFNIYFGFFIFSGKEKNLKNLGFIYSLLVLVCFFVVDIIFLFLVFLSGG